jgi:hypothetical protein
MTTDEFQHVGHGPANCQPDRNPSAKRLEFSEEKVPEYLRRDRRFPIPILPMGCTLTDPGVAGSWETTLR